MTVMLDVPLLPPVAAVIVEAPAATPVATPAVLIVTAALLRIGKDFVGFGALFEFDFGVGLVAVGAIRVVLHRHAAIGALDLLGVGGLGDAEDFVIVTLHGSHGV